ncbi:hypothetical protein ABD68_00505 [Bacillus endophyticus]|nr:hypothetical protein [Priestia endophytica]
MYQPTPYYGHYLYQYPYYYGYPVNPYYLTAMSECERIWRRIRQLELRITRLEYRWQHATSQAEKDAISRQIDELRQKVLQEEYEYNLAGCP